MSRVVLNTSIDTVFNNDVADESLSPLMVAEKLKEVADYAEELSPIKTSGAVALSVTPTALPHDVNSCSFSGGIAYLPSVTEINKQVIVIATADNIEIRANEGNTAKMFSTFNTFISNVILTTNEMYRFVYIGFGTGAGGVVDGYWKAEKLISSTEIDTAFVPKTYAATMSIVHDPKKPNFEIHLTGNLDLTITGTSNGESGIVNLYFSSTEVATLNGTTDLVIIGIGEMIPICFTHDSDGLKWYKVLQDINKSPDGSVYINGLVAYANGITTVGYLSSGGTIILANDTVKSPLLQNNTTYLVGDLPSPASIGKGAYATVTDATTPTYYAIATGGGSITWGVYCDGVNWRFH